MPATITHAFSSAIADDPADVSAGLVTGSRWNAQHVVSLAVDLATETTGSLDLVTRSTGSLDLATRTTGSLDLVTRSTGSLDLATRTTGSLDLTARSTGTIDILTQTRGATANQLMYGGASGQVAQSSGMVWNNSLSQLSLSFSGVGFNQGSLLVANSINIGSSGIANVQSGGGIGITANSRAPAVAGNGGGVVMSAGNAGANGSGGGFEMRAGDAKGATGAQKGGDLFVYCGNSSLLDPDSNAGDMYFYCGDGYGANGYGGSMLFQAGASITSTAPGAIAGSVSFSGGICYGTTGTPGDISFSVGGFSGASTTVGKFYFGSATGDPVAVTAGTGTTHAVDLPVIVDGNQYYIRLYS